MTTTGEFSGDLAAIKATVARTGVQGQWSGRNPHTFTAITRARLRWWSSTGTIVFQGPEAARDKLEDAFNAALAAQSIPPSSGDVEVSSKFHLSHVLSAIVAGATAARLVEASDEDAQKG